eukprot:scaffold5912_cov101-Cylindrotheca_fusiformis.AAC.1
MHCRECEYNVEEKEEDGATKHHHQKKHGSGMPWDLGIGDEIEIPISTHESLIQHDNERVEFHNKVRAALKDSLEYSTQMSHEGMYHEEEKEECLGEDTPADTIKRLRAQRLTIQKKETLKERQRMMQPVAHEREAEQFSVASFGTTGRILVLNKQEEETKVQFEELPLPASGIELVANKESEVVPECHPPTKRASPEEGNLRSAWSDLGCGVCFDAASWANSKYEKKSPAKTSAVATNEGTSP